jgi:hypothetical protein
MPDEEHACAGMSSVVTGNDSLIVDLQQKVQHRPLLRQENPI